MGDVVGGTDRVFVVVPVGIRVWLLLPTPLAAAQKAKQISTTVMAGTSWGSERAILKTRSTPSVCVCCVRTPTMHCSSDCMTCDKPHLL